VQDSQPRSRPEGSDPLTSDSAYPSPGEVPPPPPELPVYRVDPVMVLLLSFLTCGLYLIYWNLKVAEVLNALSGREVISPVISVLSGCCFPVHVYFYYLCGQTLPELGRRVGDEKIKDSATVLLVLGIFLPMVSAMILQGHVNRLYQR